MIDVEVARTFLRVADTGSFQLAANQLNVTQSTVSARIRTLEERLGQKVFERTRSGARLTSPGHAFQRYAQAIVQAWEEGRRVAAIGSPRATALNIGGEHNLWTRLLPLWLLELRAAFPDAELAACAADSETLFRRLAEGELDLAITHSIPNGLPLEAEHLMDDELLLVTTDPSGSFEDRFIELRWGSDASHPSPDDRPRHASTSLDLGFASINYLIVAQAAGYVPRRLAAPYIEAGILFKSGMEGRVANPIYAVWRPGPPNLRRARALVILRDLVSVAIRDQLPPPFWSQMV